MTEQVFEIIPAGSAPLWVLMPVVLLMFGLGMFFLHTIYTSKNSQVHLTLEHMEIKGGLYGRSIPLNELRVDEARRLNLKIDKTYAPSSRRNGIGLPDYQAGWFKLKNGEKSLVFVTNPKRVVYIPTENDYSLLLSVKDPDQLLAALGR